MQTEKTGGVEENCFNSVEVFETVGKTNAKNKHVKQLQTGNIEFSTQTYSFQLAYSYIVTSYRINMAVNIFMTKQTSITLSKICSIEQLYLI